MAFPEFLARRLRDQVVFPEMEAEASLSARHLVQPLFVKEDLKGRRPIAGARTRECAGQKEPTDRRTSRR